MFKLTWQTVSTSLHLDPPMMLIQTGSVVVITPQETAELRDNQAGTEKCISHKHIFVMNCKNSQLLLYQKGFQFQTTHNYFLS